MICGFPLFYLYYLFRELSGTCFDHNCIEQTAYIEVFRSYIVNLMACVIYKHSKALSKLHDSTNNDKNVTSTCYHDNNTSMQSRIATVIADKSQCSFLFLTLLYQI